jgi:hypothetical protein
MYQEETPEYDAYMLGYKRAKDHHWEGTSMMEIPKNYTDNEKNAYMAGWADASDDM